MKSLLLVIMYAASVIADPLGRAPTVGFARMGSLGWYPSAPKRIVVPRAQSDWTIKDAVTGEVVASGSFRPEQQWSASGEHLRTVDLDSLQRPGRYLLEFAPQPMPMEFTIGDRRLAPVLRGLLRGYWYWRSGIELDAAHAGAWARTMGHPDTAVLIHASAASPSRPEGTVIQSPRGWYDAGDYNKYVVNSGISTWTLMLVHAMYPELSRSLALGIPESGGRLPDLLAEIRWNLDWLLTMQDPGDGGVYHKLTNQKFDPMDAMPADCVSPRYVVMKTTAASRDFAAVMAMAYRLYREYDPAWSDKALMASRRAFQWAEGNDAVVYAQPDDIRTGKYDDEHLEDERFWAAAELFVSTGDSHYRDILRAVWPKPAAVPDWRNTGALGLITLGALSGSVPGGAEVREQAKTDLLSLARWLLDRQGHNPYGNSMEDDDFHWGSNSVAANQGMMLAVSYRLTEDRRYLDAASRQMDFLLGCNPFGRSFITGFGRNPPRSPHHRISFADGVSDPVPGYLVGGANSGRQDLRSHPEIAYPSSLPALAWADETSSYASNEIAINWNAPAAFLAAALESGYAK